MPFGDLVDFEECIILGLAETLALTALAFGDDTSGGPVVLFDGVSVEVIERSPEQAPPSRMDDIFKFSLLLSQSIDVLFVEVFAKLLIVDGWTAPDDKVRSPSWMFDHGEFDIRSVAEGYGICPEKFTSEMLSEPRKA